MCTETMLKICNNIYTTRFLTFTSIQSFKNEHHQPNFKSKFYYLQNQKLSSNLIRLVISKLDYKPKLYHEHIKSLLQPPQVKSPRTIKYSPSSYKSIS